MIKDPQLSPETGSYDEIYDKLVSGDSKKTLSASAMNTGLSCKRRFWFRYIKGWRVQSKSAALALGTAFHAGVEKLNRAQALEHQINIDDMFEEFDKFWAEESSKLEIGVDVKSEKDLETQYGIGLGLIEKYWSSTRRKQMEPMLYNPAGSTALIPAVEMKLDIPLIDLKTGKSINDDWKVIGYIDVIKQVIKGDKTAGTKKGDVCVLDYKTAAQEFSEFKLNTLLQLLLYSYAMRYILQYENMFPGVKSGKEDFVGIIECLKRVNPKGQHARTKLIKVDDIQIQILQDMIRDFIRDVENEIWLPNFSNDCGWCEFKVPCEGMMKGKDPNEWWEKYGKYGRTQSARKTVS